MACQVALDFADAVASVVPVAGSRIWGYDRAPRAPVHVLDVHGYDDVYVPANVSNGFDSGVAGAALSHDRFLYHEVPSVLRSFAARGAGCDEANAPFATKFDGTRGFVCNRPHGACANGLFVGQCVGQWGHTWPLHNTHPFAYADLVLTWAAQHPKLRQQGEPRVASWLVAPPSETNVSTPATAWPTPEEQR